MARVTQISAPVSRETKELLESYSRATGIKKGYLVESALRYHLRALQELPADALTPPRLVLTPESFQAVVRRLRRPGEPTEALKDLVAGRGD